MPNLSTKIILMIAIVIMFTSIIHFIYHAVNLSYLVNESQNDAAKLSRAMMIPLSVSNLVVGILAILLSLNIKDSIHYKYFQLSGGFLLAQVCVSLFEVMHIFAEIIREKNVYPKR
jgi:hypothetical protein